MKPSIRVKLRKLVEQEIRKVVQEAPGEERVSGLYLINKLTPGANTQHRLQILQRKYPNLKFTLTDNAKWLGKRELAGTFTLSWSGTGESAGLQSDIDKLFKD